MNNFHPSISGIQLADMQQGLHQSSSGTLQNQFLGRAVTVVEDPAHYIIDIATNSLYFHKMKTFPYYLSIKREGAMVKNQYFLLALTCVVLFPVLLFGQNTATPGALSTPYPTVTNLAVEWLMTGDANLNATCTVQFRKSGGVSWRNGMPLTRVPAGSSQGTTPTYSWQNKLSGSIFDLQPNTTYEIRLLLNDPDGGQKDTTISATTRPVPRISTSCEIIDITAGSYTSLTTKNGTSSKPVVYRSLDGQAIFDNIDIENRQWVYLEGLIVKGTISMGGAQNCVVRRCSTNGTWGITGYSPGITNCYISDNSITGPNPWTDAAMGANGDNVGEGIEFTGCGNVICNNRVKGFRDCISHMEDDEISASGQICNDFYNNDIYVGDDDGVEADFAFHNCRIMRNRLTNCFTGLSSQPGLGGPNYFIRNVMYNLTYASYKFHRYSMGDVVLHNTVVKVGDGMSCFTDQAFDYAYFRNNIGIGGPNGGVNWGGYGAGSGMACRIRSTGSHCSFDYDAVGTDATPFSATINGQDFFTVEPHGKRIYMTIFNSVNFPTGVPEHQPADLRLVSNATIIDSACVIPNINDNYSGNGPDIGAYEYGEELPLYGPRPVGIDEQTPYDDPQAIKRTLNPILAAKNITMSVSPNPFNKNTNITFSVPQSSLTVTVDIYNTVGKKVKALYSGKNLMGNSILWDGYDDKGTKLPYGVYFIKLATPHGDHIKRVIFLK